MKRFIVILLLCQITVVQAMEEKTTFNMSDITPLLTALNGHSTCSVETELKTLQRSLSAKDISESWITRFKPEIIITATTQVELTKQMALAGAQKLAKFYIKNTEELFCGKDSDLSVKESVMVALKYKWLTAQINQVLVQNFLDNNAFVSTK